MAIGCAVLGCSLTVTLSVWGRKTQDVLIFTYLIMTFWLFSRYLLAWVWGVTSLSSMRFFLPGVSDWLDSINPFYIVWAPYLSPSNVRLPWHAGFLAHCLVISCLLVALATFRIRAVARTSGVRRIARARPRWLLSHFPKPRWLPGPSLDGNPVFWREWYRAKPSRLMRLVWMLYWAMGILWVFLALQTIMSSPSTNREMIAITNVFQVAVGLLLLSVTATTSLVEERVRGSLDVLLSTPLSTRTILAGKWAGAFRSVPQLLFAPALTTLLLAGESGHWLAYLNFLGLLLAYSAAIVSLGLAWRPG